MPILLAALFAAVMGILYVSSQPDNGACLAAHTETYTESSTTWMQIGDVWMPITSSWPAERTVCDRWEFPFGRPAR